MAVSQRPVTDRGAGRAVGRTTPLWRSVPSWFLFGELDRNIPAGAHHVMAERAGARRTVEVPGASHVVGISHPSRDRPDHPRGRGRLVARRRLSAEADPWHQTRSSDTLPPDPAGGRHRRRPRRRGRGGAADARRRRPTARRPLGHRHRFTTRVQVAPGVHVAVTDLDGGRKGTVVLVPGWPLASTMLENTTLFLADRGYRAVALDLRGLRQVRRPVRPVPLRRLVLRHPHRAEDDEPARRHARRALDGRRRRAALRRPVPQPGRQAGRRGAGRTPLRLRRRSPPTSRPGSPVSSRATRPTARRSSAP